MQMNGVKRDDERLKSNSAKAIIPSREGIYDTLLFFFALERTTFLFYQIYIYILLLLKFTNMNKSLKSNRNWNLHINDSKIILYKGYLDTNY